MRLIHVRGAALCGLVFLAPATAYADEDDDFVRVRRHSETTSGEPLLTLDPVMLSQFEGIAQMRHRDTTDVSIANTHVILDGIESANVDRPERVTEDVQSRGWHAGARLTQYLGPLRLDALASVNDIETRYGSGRYYDLGLALTYTRRLSRWMTGWISLSVGRRKWLGNEPPLGEANGTQLMLSIGTTFR